MRRSAGTVDFDFHKIAENEDSGLGLWSRVDQACLVDDGHAWRWLEVEFCLGDRDVFLPIAKPKFRLRMARLADHNSNKTRLRIRLEN